MSDLLRVCNRLLVIGAGNFRRGCTLFRYMVWVATTISVVTRCGVQLTGDEMRMAGWAGLDGNVGLGKGKYRTHKSCIGVCAYMHILKHTGLDRLMVLLNRCVIIPYAGL